MAFQIRDIKIFKEQTPTFIRLIFLTTTDLITVAVIQVPRVMLVRKISFLSIYPLEK
jgi:hypothetical protein